MIQDFWGNAIFSVTPTILIGLIFWFIMRSILRADRTERKVYSQIEAEELAKIAAAKAAGGEGKASPSKKK